MDGEKLENTVDKVMSQLIDTIKKRNLENPSFVQVAIALELEEDNSLSSILFTALRGKDNDIINNLKKDINDR